MDRIEVECALVLAIEGDALFAFVADPRNDPLWVHGCRGIEMLTEQPIGRGTRLREKVSAAGIPLHVEWEVTAYEPPRRIVYASCSAPLAMTIAHELEGVAGGTEFSHRIAAEPPALLCPLRPLLRILLRREVRLNVAALGRMVAGNGVRANASRPGWRR